jgi:IclR family transcriptional regulator, pca regulon regulatory protein
MLATKPTDFMGGLAKGLAVIEAFSRERDRLAIAEVAQRTGLDRATARRCLLTLAELGYANYDGKYFELTPRVLRLSAACLTTMPLPRIVQPMLDKLSAEIGQSTSVSVLDDADIVYVARSAQQRVMSINLMPGSRLPAYCSSMGRILLAGLPEAVLRKMLFDAPLLRRTPKCLTDPDKIMKLIARAKKDGFIIVDQEIELGLRSIAVPIFDSRGRTIAALNVGVAAVHDDPKQLFDLYFEKLSSVQQALKPLLV